MPALIFALLLVDVSAQADPFFVDATREAGLERATVSGSPHKRFILESTGSGAAFFDYDQDGDLDLYVANYVVFDIEPVLQDPELENPCVYLGGLRVFCGPQGMEGGQDRLYRNDGEVFTDVTAASGVAYNGDGELEASMGVDAGDCDGDGDLDLYVTNFYGETNTLYLNSGGGTFIDATAERGLAASTVGYLGWGTRFFDFDFDGDLDLFVANGHIYPQVDHASAGGTYAQRNQLFANEGSGAFSVVEGGGPGLEVKKSSRATISGDYDQDGDVDLFTTNIDDSPTLLRNETHAGRYLVVQIDPEVVGTWVRLTAGGRTQVRSVGGAAGYLGHSAVRLHFGLGQAEHVERVEVLWPDGAVTRLEDLSANKLLSVYKEGKIVVKVLDRVPVQKQP